MKFRFRPQNAPALATVCDGFSRNAAAALAAGVAAKQLSANAPAVAELLEVSRASGDARMTDLHSCTMLLFPTAL